MTQIVGNPYEWLMQQLPGPADHSKLMLPKGHPCYGCGNAMAGMNCLLPCWKTGQWGPPRKDSEAL